MRLLPTFTPRTALILAHDLVATAAAIIVTFYLRFEGPGLAQRQDLLVAVLPAFLVYAAAVYAFDLAALQTVADQVGPTVGEVATPLLDPPSFPEQTVTPALAPAGMSRRGD